MARRSRTNVAPPLGTVLGDGYELVRYLGAGGTGAVYEARAADGRRVAVKALLRTERLVAGGEILERFKREIALLGTLESPNIVPVLDAGLDAATGFPFMVMPLLVGLDVEDLIRRVGALHPTLAVRIARQACLALEVAHDAGVVHRDIKPGNLFLDHARDGSVTVRLLDFGVAKWQRDDVDITQTGTLVGTPRYMAPEQMERAKGVDPRADVWGLGATLYHALTGVVPFAEQQTMAEVYVALMTRDLPLIQQAAPWLDPALALAVQGTLLRDREARCPSASALRSALEPLNGGSDELRDGLLQGVPTELKAHRAPPIDRPSTWQLARPDRPPPAVPDAGPDVFLGRCLSERYTLLRRLGRGGMGAVYEAEDAQGHRFAVKVLDPQRAGSSPAALGRFVREARAISSIHSDYVVRVIEVDTDSDTDVPYIVMERLLGVDLGVVIERQGPLAPRTVARLMTQACLGLGAAHERGFVHRDVKPANLFLHQQPSGDVVVKICDFGIVKRVRADDSEETAAQLTRTGGVVGSPAYMSPEQAKDARDIDLRSDVWSLGVSMFRALTGGLPWVGRESVGELIVAICTERLPHVQDLAPWVPTGLAEAVHRTIRRDPAERFQSTTELARAIEPFTEGSLTVPSTDLGPLPRELRAKAQRRATPPDAASSGGTDSDSVTSIRAELAQRRRRWTAVTLGVATLSALGAVAAGALLLGSRDDGSASGRAPDGLDRASESASARLDGGGPASHRVRVQVVPATASVAVDGKAAELQGGWLELDGVPGSSFAVLVTDGERRAEVKIVVTKDGEPSQPRIEVPAVASSAPRPEGGKPEARPRPSGLVPTASTTAGAAPTAAPSGGKPPAKETW